MIKRKIKIVRKEGRSLMLAGPHEKADSGAGECY